MDKLQAMNHKYSQQYLRFNCCD